jgi:hypothetical protein
MKQDLQNGTLDWLRKNWFLIIFIGGLVANSAVQAFKVNAMEAKLSTYPSEDYFDLKFQTLERDISNIGVLLKDHINNTK